MSIELPPDESAAIQWIRLVRLVCIQPPGVDQLSSGLLHFAPVDTLIDLHLVEIFHLGLACLYHFLIVKLIASVHIIPCHWGIAHFGIDPVNMLLQHLAAVQVPLMVNIMPSIFLVHRVNIMLWPFSCRSLEV